MIILKSHVDTTEDVLIPDVGIFIPKGGGQEQFVTVQEKSKVKNSLDLRRLATEEVVGDGYALVINDGTSDIAPDDVDTFLDSASAFQDYAEKAGRDSTDSDIIYVGRKTEGATTSDPAWQIYRINITNPDVTEYADGDTNFDNVWDDREALSYSAL